MFENDLILQINQKVIELEKSIRLLRKTGEELAKAERAYKIAVTEKALQLNKEDTKVTLINLTIYGYADIAELRFKRDVARTVHEANEEHVNATKLILRLLEAQLSREWSTDMSQ